MEESQKILTFIDVGGNEKYAKTMIRGICSYYPDYVMIVIDAERGPNETGINHFKLASAFSVPIIIVVTKIDQVSNEKLISVRQDIKNFINPDSFLITVDSDNAVSLCSRRINDENIIPVFNVSCVSSQCSGLEYLLSFLHQLPLNEANKKWNQSKEQGSEFHITETFQTAESNIPILSGIVVKGQL